MTMLTRGSTGFYTLPAIGDLPAMARVVAEIFGVPLHPEETGRFEEFPAFVGEAEGWDLTLLGSPEPEHDARENPTDTFELHVRIATERPKLPTAEKIDAFVVDSIKRKCGLPPVANGWM